MNAPTVFELLGDQTVQQALDEAWMDSSPLDSAARHEEGGWIYVDLVTGELSIQRADPGIRAAIDLDAPPLIPGSIVVATFHTHPNPMNEGWDPAPSTGDTESAFDLGVPCIVRAEDGVHWTGPESRRGGAVGPPGFPD